MVPYVKTGGLADVSAALPKALCRLGHQVTVVLPRFRGIAFPPGEFAGSVHVPVDGMARSAGFYRTRTAAGVDVVFIEYPPFFDRDLIYGDYVDNRLRFAFLARAALEYFRSRGERPSVFHAHDWQAGLRAGLPEGVLLGRPDAAPDRQRLHDPQRRVPGPVRHGHDRGPGPALEPRQHRRARVSRRDQLPEGRHRLLRAREHGLADLRARDPGPRALVRLRRRRALPRARRARDPERRRLRRVGPARRSAHREDVLVRGPRRQGGVQGRPAAQLRASRVPRPAARRGHVAARVAEGLRHRGGRLVGPAAAAAAHGGAGHGGCLRAGRAARTWRSATPIASRCASATTRRSPTR